MIVPIRRHPRRALVEALELRALLSSAGSLDPNFNGTGSATLPFGLTPYSDSSDYSTQVQSVAAGPGGKIVVSGLINDFLEPVGTSVLAVAEFNADGSIDTAFGIGGLVQVPVKYDQKFAMAVQPNGQIIEASATTDAAGNNTYLVIRLDANGAVDSTFGTGGVAEYPASTTTPAADRLGSITSVVLQSNNQIVLAGSDSNEDLAAARLNTDGSLDTSYGTDGTVDVPVSANGIKEDTAAGAAIQANGQVVLAGTAYTGTIYASIGGGFQAASDVAVVRLNTDGAVDSTFGTSGVVVLPPNPANPSDLASIGGVAIAVDPTDQKIVLSFSSSNYTAGDTAANGNVVERLDTDGTPDTTFGNGGRVMPSFSGFNPDVSQTYPYEGSLAVEPDGQIIVFQTASSGGSGPDAVGGGTIARLNSDGSVDSTFGNTTTPAGYQTGLKSVTGAGVLTLQPSDGDVILAGSGIVLTVGGGPIEGFSVASLLSTSTAGPAAKPLPPTAPASFDRSGVTNLAVYLPSASVNQGSGIFAYRPEDFYSYINQVVQPGDIRDQYIPFGITGLGQTIPAPADYLGSGSDELGAYLPASGVYEIQQVGSNFPSLDRQFGVPGVGQSIPVPADYYGTGQADVAVYITSQGVFAILAPGDASGEIVPFGPAGAGQSIPAPGDYYGTGQADIAVYLAQVGAFAIQDPTGKTSGGIIPFGKPGLGNSIPVPGDYDGSGLTELAVYVPSAGAYFYRPADGGPDVRVNIGTANSGEVPVPGDYDGSGRLEAAIYDPAKGFFEYAPAHGGPDVVVYFGSPNGGSLPVAEPAGALPEFAAPGSSPGANAIRPNFVPSASNAPAASVAITLTHASAVPAGPTLASTRVALSLVNQGDDDSSALTP